MARYFCRRRTWGRKKGLFPYRPMGRKEARNYFGNISTMQRSARRLAVAPNTLLSNVYNTSSPFPKGMITKQSYSEVLNLTAGTSGVFGTEQVYILNAMFDPDYSVGGHQPYGRDTLSSIYSRYKVLGVYIDVTFYSPSSGSSIATGIKLSPNDQLTNPLQGATLNQVIEGNNTVVKYLPTTGSQKTHFRAYFPMHKLLQLSKLQFKADSTVYDTPVGQNPSRSVYMRLAVCDATGSSAGTCVASVKITMLTYWHERKQLPQS